ncbi:DUF4292 domain-containing protein [Aureivirga sp. CE67]|uniref:DUF4292 domain-containing protein n=1 Tax=Aureivirga sp. CE67 TaxID=1788983 RepID=UPI0018C9DF36|nr:DUF4292 domain-containing protein [Aureivirga sp. CE67]
MKSLLKYTLLISVLVLSSCKSTKNVTSNVLEVKEMSSKKIIKRHYKNELPEKTVLAKMKVRYEDPNQTQNVTVKLRMEVDKKIWISAGMFGITGAKMLITPDNVKFYNTIDNTYFDGDFEILSNFLGTDLDFEKVQNLLLGQAIYDLKDGRYSSEIEAKNYLLTPKKQKELFDLFFWINPSNYKVAKQHIIQEEKNQELTIDYQSYQTKNNIIFPKDVEIIANSEDKITKINIDYKSVELDKKLSFPFKIPKGYKEISLD